MTKFKAAMQRFRANAPAFDATAFDEQMDRELKREALCKCGKPVAVLSNRMPCVQCKSCIAKRLVGDVDALKL